MKLWDPADQEISEESFDRQVSVLENKFQEYQQHPGKIAKQNQMWLMVGVLGIAIAILIMYFFQALFRLAFAVVFISFAPWGLFQKKVNELQGDVVNLLIARSHGWIYNPDPDKSRWGYLGTKFPQIFLRGDRDQYLEDQYWGSISETGKALEFWLGIFHFTIKAGKSSVPFIKTTIAVHLPETLQNPFYLHSRTMEASMTGLFRHKAMQTENLAFNKEFDIYTNDEDQVGAEAEAIRLISPAVQERLLKLKAEHGSFSLLFQGDVVIFSFSGALLKREYTTFFKAVALDPRDEAQHQALFSDLFGLIGGMMRFLD